MAILLPPSENNVNKDPFLQFESWFRMRFPGDPSEPNPVSLSTSGPDGRVSSRIVLIKSFDENGFVFFTNYESKKGNQLGFNPNAALLFYWPEQNRQIRIEGSVEKVSSVVSDIYFDSRPRGSQVSASISNQSQPVTDRKYLENLYERLSESSAGRKITRPPNWGGYILVPVWFEFWQDREDRLHDRITYSLGANGWSIKRLAP